MADILDDLNQIKKLDKSNVYGSVEALPDQCWHAWQEAGRIKVPSDYSKVKNLVMTGMGGSGLGARLIESLYQYQLQVPIIRVSNYALPGFVNKDTLVICSSYSGSTEEVVENLYQALKKKAKIMVIATGKDLINIALKHKLPFYQIKPDFNPSQQPRMAIGYSVVGQLVLVSKAGLIKLTEQEIKSCLKLMRQIQKGLGVNTNSPKNEAKKTALKLYDKVILYFAASHLSGAVHTVKNQLNENAKVLAARFDVPELNHHLMEGLRFPASNKKDLIVFLAKSNLYHKRIQERFELTQDVVGKNKIETYVFEAKGQTRLEQAFELIQFGAYVNFYLAMLAGIDPAPIPWVDYFKEKLSK